MTPLNFDFASRTGKNPVQDALASIILVMTLAGAAHAAANDTACAAKAIQDNAVAGCDQAQGQAALEAENRIKAELRKIKGYKRDESQTYLTLPEWYLVYSPAEYAQYLKDKPPSGFPYFGSIRQFWGYCGDINDAYTHRVSEDIADYRVAPTDKSNMSKYIFGGFHRCLYHLQKFDSDSERKLAVILERDAIKWFKPAKGQFQIFYRNGADPLEYQPDFVAESGDTIYMLEPKASNQLKDPIVLAKQDVAVKWCVNATNHAATYGGKPWRYVLIPHDEIAVNMTLAGLAERFGV